MRVQKFSLGYKLSPVSFHLLEYAGQDMCWSILRRKRLSENDYNPR